MFEVPSTPSYFVPWRGGTFDRATCSQCKLKLHTSDRTSYRTFVDKKKNTWKCRKNMCSKQTILAKRCYLSTIWFRTTFPDCCKHTEHCIRCLVITEKYRTPEKKLPSGFVQSDTWKMTTGKTVHIKWPPTTPPAAGYNNLQVATAAWADLLLQNEVTHVSGGKRDPPVSNRRRHVNTITPKERPLDQRTQQCVS